jgi:hypothetical protein
MHQRVSILLPAIAVIIVACTAREQPATRVDSSRAAVTPEGTPYAYERIALDTTRPPGTIIDSVFPIPEMIRRFRTGLPETSVLSDGEPTRQALVTRFIMALSRKDRSVLGRLTLSRAEFAYLYFPNTPDATNPNGMPPTLRWDGIMRNSEKGATRALSRVGGQSLTLEALDCPNAPVSSGAMRLHHGCTVRINQADGSVFNGRLFGSIIEIAGRFKFVGYSNDM